MEVETSVETVLDGIAVRGRIDAVFEEAGPDGEPCWVVVDWKTGDEPADPLQLAIYRLAWARLAGVDPSAVEGVFLHVGSGEEVRFGDDLPGEAELAELLRGEVEVETLTLL